MSAGRFFIPVRRFCAAKVRLPFSEVAPGYTTSLSSKCEGRSSAVSSQYASRTDMMISRRFLASAAAPLTEPKVDYASSTQEGNEQATVDDGAVEREKRFTAEITKLKEDSASILDKYKRSLAETENLRQRLTRQIDDAKQFGIQSFVKDLLEVSDLLSRAITSTPKEALSSQNQPLKDLYEGLRLTEAQLSKVFKSHGLEKYDPMGEVFDPNFHEAVFQAPIPGKEPNTIMEVAQTGFKLRNRVIRPARVGVVRSP